MMIARPFNRFPARPQRKSLTRDAVGIALVIGFVASRFLTAGNDYSYDYFAYIYYFGILGDYSLSELFGNGLRLFPYVVIPGAAVFEIGFVLLAKLSLAIFIAPNVAYAAIAACSVGIRVYVMRKLGAPWFWILIVQVYAVTLFEANAIRVGLAASLALFGLYLLYLSKPRLGWLLLVCSILVHLQAGLFLAPFGLAWGFRKYMDKSRQNVLLIALLMTVLTAVLISSGLLASHSKIADYANRSSNSAGVNFTSMSALSFAFLALLYSGKQVRHSRERLLWVSTVTAITPSLVLFVAVTSIAALGDRAWQFAFVIVSALLFTKWAGAQNRLFPTLILVGIGVFSAMNVTLRYPLSNFFDFILPHVPIWNN